MTNSSQPTLFDIHPLGTEPPIAQRVITPGCLLPAADNKFIDINRVCSIFGVSMPTSLRLLENGHLRGYRLRDSSPWLIEYESVVEHCDKLRVEYHIADRRLAGRARPSRDGRWRDADLLPFPIADTVYTQDVMTGLNLPRIGAIRLCEEGRFECYRMMPIAGVPWRISKTSLFEYCDRLKAQLRPRPAPAKAR